MRLGPRSRGVMCLASPPWLCALPAHLPNSVHPLLLRPSSLARSLRPGDSIPYPIQCRRLLPRCAAVAPPASLSCLFDSMNVDGSPRGMSFVPTAREPQLRPWLRRQCMHAVALAVPSQNFVHKLLSAPVPAGDRPQPAFPSTRSKSRASPCTLLRLHLDASRAITCIVAIGHISPLVLHVPIHIHRQPALSNSQSTRFSAGVRERGKLRARTSARRDRYRPSR